MKEFGKLIDNAIKIGLNGGIEYAWTAEQVPELIEVLRTYNVPILGGDVYKYVDNKLEHTFDTWYLPLNDISNNIEKTFLYTSEYIKNYENNDGQFVYVIIIHNIDWKLLRGATEV